MVDWKHPVEKPLNTVVFVAMGPSKLAWVNSRIDMNPDIEPDQLWTLNAGADWVGNADLTFYMDDLLDQFERFPGTAKKLKKLRCPIITTVPYPQLELQAPQFQYPLEDVLKFVGPSQAYFVNSVPYVIPYALMIGVKRLIMYGVDYDYPGIDARENGRACCEFWIGWALAKGMLVQVTESSSLLDARKGRTFYGYLRQPIIIEGEPPK